MSIHEVTMYRVRCDWPGCKSGADDETDYWAWSGVGEAVQSAENADWYTDKTEVLHYCRDHVTTWASDHEDGEPYPEPPFLLIHDGDTGSFADDGHVSLVS